MKQDCLDIGLIQAFMDGELDHAQRGRVSGHIAVCDHCTFTLADAEEESAVVFPALEREFNSLVPTQRLWTKINDSIVEERESRPFWQKAWAFVSVGIMTPSLVTAAGVLIVVGISTLVLIDRQQGPIANAPTTAVVKPATIPSTSTAAVPRDDGKVTEPDQALASTAPAAYSVERADYRQSSSRNIVRTSPGSEPSAAAERPSGYMPGEENYVKTIGSLARSVDLQKDNSMRGSERVAFERDMSVVDDAIAKMRVEVRKDPRNETAKQVLYSSYQNKIDLLNSVSQKEELVASLK